MGDPSRSGRARALEGRLALGEGREPGGEARMILPPFHRLAPVEITERAGKPDGDDIGLARFGRRLFESGESARDLAALMLEPALRLCARVAEAAFIDDQDRGLGDAVGQ